MIHPNRMRLTVECTIYLLTINTVNTELSNHRRNLCCCVYISYVRFSCVYISYVRFSCVYTSYIRFSYGLMLIKDLVKEEQLMLGDAQSRLVRRDTPERGSIMGKFPQMMVIVVYLPGKVNLFLSKK